MARKCVEGCTCGKHTRSGNRRVLVTTCHPERPHFSNGLCRQCYFQTWWIEVGKSRYLVWKEGPEYQKFLAKQKEAYLEDPEKFKAANRESYQRTKAGYIARANKYRASKLEVTVELVDLGKILERDGLTCYLCGDPVNLEDVEYDHVIPLSRGGSHSYENLKVTHRWCNRRKWNKLLEELELVPVQKEVI